MPDEQRINIRYIMGKAKCRVEVWYGNGAKLRNVQVVFLEGYKWIHRGID